MNHVVMITVMKSDVHLTVGLDPGHLVEDSEEIRGDLVLGPRLPGAQLSPLFLGQGESVLKCGPIRSQYRVS